MRRKTAGEMLRGEGGLPPTITAREAADLLNLSLVQVRRLCHDGTIKAAKIGRSWHIDRDALLEQLGLLD